MDWTFYGSMPGTLTMAKQYGNGATVVVLFNTRFDRANVEITGDHIAAALDAIVAQVNWAAFDER